MANPNRGETMKETLRFDPITVASIVAKSPDGRRHLAVALARFYKEEHGIEIDPESVHFEFDEDGMVTGATVEASDGDAGV